MTKPTKKQQETEPSEGVKFREGYYKHHGLGIGRLCTNEENKACMKVVLDVLYRRITEREGQERIKELLHPEVPF